MLYRFSNNDTESNTAKKAFAITIAIAFTIAMANKAIKLLGEFLIHSFNFE